MKPQRSHRNAVLTSLALVAGTLAIGAGVSHATGPSVSGSVAATTVPAPTTPEPAENDSVPADTVAPAEPGDDVVAEDTLDDCIAEVAVSDEEFAEDFASMDADQKAAMVAEMEAAAAELIQELDDAGVAYTLEVDPVTGVSWPIPDEDDPDAKALFESWETEEPVMIDSGITIGSDEDYAEYFNSLDESEKAAMIEEQQADAAEFRQELDDAGVAYTTETDPVTGVEWPMPDLNDPAALELMADDCALVIEGGFGDDFTGTFDSLSAEDQAEIIEQMTADAAALVEALDNAGVAYKLEVDSETGVSWPMPDGNEEAYDSVVEDFVTSYGCDEDVADEDVADDSATESSAGQLDQ